MLLLARKALRKIVKPFYLCIIDELALCDLSRAPRPPLDRAESPFQCRPLEPTDRPKIEEARGAAQMRDFDQRTAEGSQGHLILEGDRLAGWAWTCHHPKQGEGFDPFYYDVAPPEGHAYIFDVFILPAYRRRGAVTQLMAYLVDWMRQAGYSHAFMTYDARGIAMQRIAAHFGFQSIGRLTWRRFLGFVRRDVSALENLCGSS